MNISIHALLAESDLKLFSKRFCNPLISIHALLAESDCFDPLETLIILIFLSTLSLRRATHIVGGAGDNSIHFYPRSPCGERPAPQISVILII